MILYAGWTEGYVVTFDAGDGNFYDNAKLYTTTILQGDVVANDPGLYAPEGMVFDHWELADGTHVDTWNYIPTGDVALYAQYVTVYNITFNGNGGYFWSEDTLTITVPYPDGNTISGSDYVPVSFDSHMAFTGWYYDPDCTQPALDMNETISATQDMILYAGWTEGYVVTFDAGDGNFYDNAKLYTTTILQGDVVANDPGLYAPEGMVFDHWELKDGTPVNVWEYVPTGDVTLYAKYVRAYTVTFNGNGGWFWEENGETALTYSFGEGSGIYKNDYAPTAPDPHMVFTGWYFDEACTNPAWNPDDNNIIVNSDMTLYAGWTEGYAVTYDAGEGNYGENVAQYIEVIPRGEVIGNGFWPNPPEGMTFDHWELADGTHVDTWDYVPTGDVTLYAKYVRAYTVTFNGNGGWFWEEGGETAYPVTYAEGSFIYRMDYTPTAPDPHMLFSGWYLDEACTNPAWNPDDNNIIVNSDMTLYAGWTDAYIVTLDAGDGYYSDGTAQHTKTIPQGNSIGWIEEPYAPENMAFDHWELEDGSTVYPWNYIPTGDVTLYAKYVRAYAVTFDANGGYISETDRTTYTTRVNEGNYAYGAIYGLKHSDPRMAFNGWYRDPACTQFVCGWDDSFKPTSDLTLYAGWAEGWIVSFDPGEGSLGEGAETSIAVAKGSRLDYFPYAEPADTENYTFTYWTFQDGTRVPDDYYPTEDVTLYAHYAPLLAVSFDGNGGEWVYNDGTTRTRLEGKLPEGYRTRIDYLLSPPTRPQERMAFTGWYADADCNELVVAPGGELYVDKAMTLYAGWTDGFILTFDANGGSDGPESQTVARDGSSPLVRGFPQREGWIFVGWASSANADAPQFFPHEPISVNADTTLYAVWKQPDFVLPMNLTEIGEEAFAGGNFTFVFVPWQVETIGPRAFADCPNLKYVFIFGDTRIHSTAFQNDTGLVLIAQNSNLKGFAQQNNYHFIHW